MKRALVIGGTGATGPDVVAGLQARGFDVTILHGGQHEVEHRVPVHHIHCDPHFAEPLEANLADSTFDLVVALYGRLRVVAKVLKGRTDRLIAIGGATRIFADDDDERWGALGKPAIFPDSEPVYARDIQRNKIGVRMAEAMETLFETHPESTYIGYSLNYGPRNPGPVDWCVIKRVLDGRQVIVVADGGLKLDSRVYTENAAAAVLLAVDKHDVAAGKRYTITDERQFTMTQRIQFIANYLGRDLQLIDMPYSHAWPCYPLWRHVPGHRLCRGDLIREELGYKDPVPPETALARTIDWLVANPPDKEVERQIADPFDYAAEDLLIERWQTVASATSDLHRRLPDQGHPYRHPTKLGERWDSSPKW